MFREAKRGGMQLQPYGSRITLLGPMPQIKMPENMGGRDFVRVDEVTNKANCNIGSIKIRL